MPKKFQIEAHFHGKESGDTLLIVQVENVDIICSSWCVPTDMLLEDRNRGARDLIVSHPLMACSFLLGAAFLALCDALSRTVIAPTEIPVGVVTALAGGPFFIWLLRSKRRSLWL